MREQYHYCPQCREHHNVEVLSLNTLMFRWPMAHQHLFVAGDMLEVWYYLNEKTGEKARVRNSYRCLCCSFEWDRTRWDAQDATKMLGCQDGHTKSMNIIGQREHWVLLAILSASPCYIPGSSCEIGPQRNNIRRNERQKDILSGLARNSNALSVSLNGTNTKLLRGWRKKNDSCVSFVWRPSARNQRWLLRFLQKEVRDLYHSWRTETFWAWRQIRLLDGSGDQRAVKTKNGKKVPAVRIRLWCLSLGATNMMIKCPNCNSLYWRYSREGLDPNRPLRLCRFKVPADVIIARQFYTYWVWNDENGDPPYRIMQSYMCNECKFVWRSPSLAIWGRTNMRYSEKTVRKGLRLDEQKK